MDNRSIARHSFVLLDGVRGLGVIMVLMGHTITAWGLPMPQSGNIVVDAFFLISGFVIAYAYEPRFAAGMGAGEFMLQRLIRLFPLYLLGTVAVYLVLVAIAASDPDAGDRIAIYATQLIPQLFMLPSPELLHTKDFYSLNTPAYTLFFELAVNLVYVLIFRWLTTRMLVGLVAATGVVLAITIFHFGFLGTGSDWATWWGGFPRAAFGFFLGVLAYRIVGSPRTAERPASWMAVPMLVLLPIVCFIPATQEMRPFVDMALAFGLFLPLVLLGQSIRPPDGLTGVCFVGGQISYAVYILQQPLREIYERMDWRSTFLQDTAPAGGFLALVVMLAVSYYAEKYYDRPVRRALVRMIKQRRAKAAEKKPALAA